MLGASWTLLPLLAAAQPWGARSRDRLRRLERCAKTKGREVAIMGLVVFLRSRGRAHAVAQIPKAGSSSVKYYFSRGFADARVDVWAEKLSDGVSGAAFAR